MSYKKENSKYFEKQWERFNKEVINKEVNLQRAFVIKSPEPIQEEETMYTRLHNRRRYIPSNNVLLYSQRSSLSK
tara:strand:+ start:328 stop:552 length:225 start_codon:yes stop_codon:yes gene_type:complete